MTQDERLRVLIDMLIEESARWQQARAAGELAVPSRPDERYRLWRSLVNVREPAAASDEYLAVEDAFLAERVREQGVVGLADLGVSAGTGELAEWQGDICRLAVDAIVNAANSQMLGCFVPCHGCIDNAIHTAAGVRLRLACANLMGTQGTPEKTGQAKITPGFNLPAAHVIHTVGPIVRGPWPTARDRELLASCYRSCLELACEQGLGSIAFCCISTGEFRFPQEEAARIAVATVREERSQARAAEAPFPTVVFNTFKEADHGIYQRLLG